MLARRNRLGITPSTRPTSKQVTMPNHPATRTHAHLHPMNKRQKWWLPVLGPTATVLAYTLARHTPREGSRWDTADLARRIGLAGNRSKLWQSLNRLEQFGVARFHATDVLTIRLWLPALTDGQLARLPDDMAEAYHRTHHQPMSA